MALEAASRSDIEAILARDSRAAYATLVRLLGDFDLAEDALQDAVCIALERWTSDGIPQNPFSWLISTARFRAIDRGRRRKRFVSITSLDEETLRDPDDESTWDETHTVEDDVLRLIFTCCHPAISIEAQIALTLREVCGLTTEEIASAFLLPVPTLAQRLVRAKGKIRDSKIPFEMPDEADLVTRFRAVQRVVYLVFNEGYSATGGATLVRADLVNEAIRIAEIVQKVCPNPESQGLLALMYLHRARQSSRMSIEGEIVSIEDQDRSLWDTDQIELAATLVDASLTSGAYGAYTLQAAIALAHATAKTYRDTDWAEITCRYDELLALEPSPIVELNRAIAISKLDGPERAIQTVERLLSTGGLERYYPAHAVHAELCQKLGRPEQAKLAYDKAIELATHERTKQILRKRRSLLG